MKHLLAEVAPTSSGIVLVWTRVRRRRVRRGVPERAERVRAAPGVRDLLERTVDRGAELRSRAPGQRGPSSRRFTPVPELTVLKVVWAPGMSI